ncbi:DUF721 domain-containing protein [Acetobacter cerevisiae]|uniref:DUF721 domain-containing protein n=2 Tax=Acetobacter cerevisiae TaxID=178900 RepID=A0ABT1ER36_9PROT|nr:DUF721 domain-containing protein [Acetobacter cerevisiae]MCP1245837.1 DUF721 domain-containing protein [Acetobacter cerevisiae]MCP1255289.1 DUF721 domain-containing protein [Acetobacter cerevisiae]
MTKESPSGKTTGRKTATTKKAQTPPAPPRRAMTARSLAALLPNVTAPAFKKRSPAGVQLFTDWADIVGPAHAAVTTPRKLSAGTLSIACAGPVAMELQHLSDALIARINTWCGQALVARLRFVQDPAAGQRITARRTPKAATRPCHLPDMEDSPLKEALESLGAHIVPKKAGR